MFAIHYLKKMAASFFTDKNSNRKHISKEKGCNLRQIRGKSCKEARYGSSRIKGEIQRNKKKIRNTKKKVFRPKNPREVVINGSRAMTTVGFLQATNLLERQPDTTTKTAPNKKDSTSKNGSKLAAEVVL